MNEKEKNNKNSERKLFKLKPGESVPGSGVASTKKIEQYNDIMNEFMEKIFGHLGADFFLTDESSLGDFEHFEFNMTEIKNKIQKYYSLNMDGMDEMKLHEIFRMISAMSKI